MSVEDVDEVEEPLALEEGIDTLEVAVSLNVRKGDGTCAVHGYTTAVVEFGERTPNPEKVSLEGWFVLQRLDGNPLLCPDLFEPVPVF
jgi:predicted RNA-binding protein with TRAM domain